MYNLDAYTELNDAICVFTHVENTIRSFAKNFHLCGLPQGRVIFKELPSVEAQRKTRRF